MAWISTFIFASRSRITENLSLMTANFSDKAVFFIKTATE